ncbi:hypothetical protein PNOK_0272700 [Pyrrhoderma noxium]|uniref:Uncharacterized protein n=1 Tax=Pyrrhoderma noxium TaxID=2282107 RepID=A0A286UT51_9AGAM|nr:hypothetical protein PNOK_0272700 [Pyrrhoderma noxium]
MSLESILDKSPSIKARPRDDESIPSTRGRFTRSASSSSQKRAQKVKLRGEDWDLSAAIDMQILGKTICICLPGVINPKKCAQTILQSKLLTPALLGIAVERAGKSADGYLNRSSLRKPPFISSGHNPNTDLDVIDAGSVKPPPASIEPSELGSRDGGDSARISKGKGKGMEDTDVIQHSRSTGTTRRSTRIFLHDRSKLVDPSSVASTSRLETNQEREQMTLDSIGPGRSKTHSKNNASRHAKSEKVVGEQKESKQRSKKSYEEDNSGEEAEDEEDSKGSGSKKSSLSKKKRGKAVTVGDKT